MEKFHFVPLSKRKKIATEAFVKIYKPGNVQFGKWTLIQLGINLEQGTFIKFFTDHEKRTIAFKLLDKVVQSKGDGIRLLKPLNVEKTGTIYAIISVQNFLKSLDDVPMPSGKLPIQEYNDNIYGKVFYFTIPKQPKTA